MDRTSEMTESEENPFQIPSDQDVFLIRLKEREDKNALREQMKNMKIWQKTSNQHSNTTTKVKFESSLKSKQRQEENQGILGEQRREKENMADFIEKKREMFLVQMSLDTKRDEIRKLEEKAQMKEQALLKSELMLEEDALRFDAFLKENNIKAHEAIKRHEKEVKAKQEKISQIKKLNQEIAKVKSEMDKYNETLAYCRKYKAFLDELTPSEWFIEQQKKKEHQQKVIAQWNASNQQRMYRNKQRDERREKLEELKAAETNDNNDENMDEPIEHERLMLSGIDHKVLDCQRRMIPQISELSSFHYNSDTFHIQNHESTKERDDIQGISQNVILFNHAHHEEEDANIQSKYNMFEAKMIVEMTIYLLKQKIYKPSDITILTLYRGQELKIKSLVRSNKTLQNLLNRYRSETDKKTLLNIKVVDKYQGEENDIVLLSLVRSNKRNAIGFVKIDNRICVALSRAKNGLYAFGNFDMYAKVSDSWKTIRNIAEKNNYLQNCIKLKCKRHNNVIIVQKPEDFRKSPEGGCTLKCEERLDCGHVCTRLCHSYDHKYVQCLKPCTKFHEPCKHLCQRKCYEDCGKCEVIISKTLPCNHIVGVPCWQSVDTVKCPKQIAKTFADCDHVKIIPCHQRNESIECDVRIDIEFKECEHVIKNVPCKDKWMEKYAKCSAECEHVLECGHKCGGVCSECVENGNRHKCGWKCNRLLVCGHQCDRVHVCTEACPPCDKKCENECPHSKCNKKCGEPCVVCKEKCTRSCQHHQCTKVCSEKCDFIRCERPCTELLECGYQCPGVCGEECLPFCREKKCAQHHAKQNYNNSKQYRRKNGKGGGRRKFVEHRKYERNSNSMFVYDKDFMAKNITECDEDSLFIVLTDCAHIIEKSAIDRYVYEYRKNNSTKIKLIPCPLCAKPIRKTNQEKIF